MRLRAQPRGLGAGKRQSTARGSCKGGRRSSVLRRGSPLHVDHSTPPRAGGSSNGSASARCAASAICAIRAAFLVASFAAAALCVCVLSDGRRAQKRSCRRGAAHILLSLEAAPPVTLATRRAASSVLSSSSCFSRSVLLLFLNSCTEIFMATCPAKQEEGGR